MPLYDFRCEQGHRFERMVPLASFAEVQICDCGEPSQRAVCAPHIVSDCIAPIRGADGKMHDSKSAYMRSLTPSGNPRGESYQVLGAGEQIEPVKHKTDGKKLRDDIARSIAEVKQGRRAMPVAIDGV
jgi:putative FmdB family regulatory protein